MFALINIFKCLKWDTHKLRRCALAYFHWPCVKGVFLVECRSEWRNVLVFTSTTFRCASKTHFSGSVKGVLRPRCWLTRSNKIHSGYFSAWRSRQQNWVHLSLWSLTKSWIKMCFFSLIYLTWYQKSEVIRKDARVKFQNFQLPEFQCRTNMAKFNIRDGAVASCRPEDGIYLGKRCLWGESVSVFKWKQDTQKAIFLFLIFEQHFAVKS